MDNRVSQSMDVFLQWPHGGGVTQMGVVERAEGPVNHISHVQIGVHDISAQVTNMMWREAERSQSEKAVAKAWPWTESKLDSINH